MSDPNPLTAGGFAPSPIYPTDPTPDDDTLPDDDDWLLQDFLQARAMAPTLGVMARLDAVAAAYGEEDGPSVETAAQAAPPPNGGVILHYAGSLTDDELAALRRGQSPAPPAPSAPPSTPPSPPPPPASGTSPSPQPPEPSSPPPDTSNTEAQPLPPPATPAPSFPPIAPAPDFALDDWDIMPFGLKLQRAAETMAPAKPGHSASSTAWWRAAGERAQRGRRPGTRAGRPLF